MQRCFILQKIGPGYPIQLILIFIDLMSGNNIIKDGIHKILGRDFVHDYQLENNNNFNLIKNNPIHMKEVHGVKLYKY